MLHKILMVILVIYLTGFIASTLMVIFIKNHRDFEKYILEFLKEDSKRLELPSITYDDDRLVNTFLKYVCFVSWFGFFVMIIAYSLYVEGISVDDIMDMIRKRNEEDEQ